MACIYESDNVLLQQKVLRIVDSIRYTKWLDAGNSKEDFEKTRLGFFSALFCNDDWYVIVDFMGQIHCGCLEDDPRARKEMEATIAVIKEKANNKEEIRKLAISYNEKRLNS